MCEKPSQRRSNAIIKSFNLNLRKIIVLSKLPQTERIPVRFFLCDSQPLEPNLTALIITIFFSHRSRSSVFVFPHTPKLVSIKLYFCNWLGKIFFVMLYHCIFCITIIFFILYFKISQYKKYVMYFRNTKSYKFQKCCITKYFLLKILTIKLLLQKYKKTKKKCILSITVYK